MLVGGKNEINRKIVNEISEVFPIVFKNYKDVIEKLDSVYTPRILLINLMDVGSFDEKLIPILKEKYPALNIIAIHCYQSQEMIEKTISKGYDNYISIFDLSNEFSNILQQEKVV